MAILKEFIEFVEREDKISVKIALENSMLIDPTLIQFNKMLDYASSKMNLFDVHDGRELIYDKYKWNKEYLDQEMVRVVDNFSKERIDLLKKMVKHLYKSEVSSSRINNQHTSKTQVVNKNRDVNVSEKNGFLKKFFNEVKSYFEDNPIKSIYKCYKEITKIINGTSCLDTRRKYDVRKYTEDIISNCQKFFNGEMSLRSDLSHKKNINEEIREQLFNIRENISKYSNSNDYNKKQIIRDIAQSAYKIQMLLK